MKLIILAAGFSKGDESLALTRPIPLIPVADRPLIEHSLDQIFPNSHISGILVVTNGFFSNQFQSWVRKSELIKSQGIDVQVISNGYTQASQSRGALYDIQLALSHLPPDESVLIYGGDNVIFDRVDAFIEMAMSLNAPSVVACESSLADRVRDLSSLSMDAHNRITYFEEKPQEPRSTTSAALIYYLPAGTAQKVTTFLSSGINPDRPGRFIEWLIRQGDPVYGWHFDGTWYDVENSHTLEEVERIILNHR